MSNYFNKSSLPRNKEENKQNNQKNNLLNNLKEKNPNTIIITKAKRKINLNAENNNNNIKPAIKEQNAQKLNVSKKAKNSLRDSNKSNKNNDMNPKTFIVNKSHKKSLKNINNNVLKDGSGSNNKKNNEINFNNNFLKDENNEVNTYLKNKSASKNNKNKKAFLSESINLNALNFGQEANEIEENKVKKLIDKAGTNKNKELFKINEEETTQEEFSLKLKLKQKEKTEREIEKNSDNKINNNRNYNTNKMFKRSMTKRPSMSYNLSGKEMPLLNLERKNSLKLSSKELGRFRSSLKDTMISRSSITFFNSVNNVIIPLLNKRKENNCFLNVIIQNLAHLTIFKNDYLISSDVFTKSKPINELYNLIKLYEDEQIKNKDNKDTIIEPVLSVNNLRVYLNEIFNRYHKGESGDPMETMNSLFDLIHEAYCKKNRIEEKNVISCKCLAHKHFFLKLADIQYCPNCNSKKVQLYDKDCFMYNLFIKDILDKLHGKSFNSFKLKLFQKIKENNKTFEENKPKIPGCYCNEKLKEFYKKTTRLMGPLSTYLIINITFAEEFPSMNDILKTYMLLPVNEKIHNLFSFDKSVINLINFSFYIKGIILYGIYHYVCALYIKDENRWAIVDDKTIKYIDTYFGLIDSLLRNHLIPVGIIYSKDDNDSLTESVINTMSISKDEYAKLFQFCKDVDKKRNLKTSEIFQSKVSFDEEKGDYINNNLFYSIFDNNKNEEKNTQDLINNIVIPNEKKEENKIIENKEEKKDKNIFKGGIFSFTKKYGNNLRGGIIDFSDINKEKESEDKNDDIKADIKEDINEDNELLNIGNEYED